MRQIGLIIPRAARLRKTPMTELRLATSTALLLILAGGSGAAGCGGSGRPDGTGGPLAPDGGISDAPFLADASRPLLHVVETDILEIDVSGGSPEVCAHYAVDFGNSTVRATRGCPDAADPPKETYGSISAEQRGNLFAVAQGLRLAPIISDCVMNQPEQRLTITHADGTPQGTWFEFKYPCTLGELRVRYDEYAFIKSELEQLVQ